MCERHPGVSTTHCGVHTTRRGVDAPALAIKCEGQSAKCLLNVRIKCVYDAYMTMGKRSRQSQKTRRSYQKQRKRRKLEEKITGELLQIDTAASSAASTHLDPQMPPASHAQTASSSPECSWITTDESTDDDPTFSRSISPPLDIAENEDPACLIVVDKERKLEVHISDPDYQQLPGAEVLHKNTSGEYMTMRGGLM